MSNNYSDGNGVNCILLTTERTLCSHNAGNGDVYSYLVYIGNVSETYTNYPTYDNKAYIHTGSKQGSFLATQYNGRLYIMPKTEGLNTINQAALLKYTHYSADGFYITGSSAGAYMDPPPPINEFFTQSFAYTTPELSIIPVSTSDPAAYHGNPGVTQAIPVQWRKPGGVLLQTSFDITVN